MSEEVVEATVQELTEKDVIAYLMWFGLIGLLAIVSGMEGIIAED